MDFHALYRISPFPRIFRVASSIDQFLTRAVFHFTYGRGHQLTKKKVDRFNYAPAAPEVFSQVDAARLPAIPPGGILPVFLQEQAGIGQTKPVNALFNVPHQEQVRTLLPPAGYQLENGLLHCVDILIFIHQHLNKAILQLQSYR
ncbi:MAG: hypothetical protein BWY80_00393 [Firmicutes bacterium ADurb.Bin456]|nr:MAG: hypothetical protein BWY80_00393 [Firmicutes bacterium ADurb.Bin456]